ncbi:response regulator [Neorhizobium sp. DAR64860/K0K1]|uniref:response regulator n=1 Tax=Neorhizobium sp. DAR64860/K0K1 TaxID=3421955 RepID=UPI003D280196
MRIVIVEDEALLALEMESELTDAGHEVVGLAGDHNSAMELVRAARPDLAFVDIQLLDGPTGIEVGRELAFLRVPYVFVSANLKRIPADYVGAIGAIEKPYTANGFQSALAYLEAYVGGERVAYVPPSLVLATTEERSAR